MLQSGVVTIDEDPHAQQTSDICERHHVDYGAFQLESVWLKKLMGYVQSKFHWLTKLLTPIMLAFRQRLLTRIDWMAET